MNLNVGLGVYSAEMDLADFGPSDKVTVGLPDSHLGRGNYKDFKGTPKHFRTQTFLLALD